MDAMCGTLTTTTAPFGDIGYVPSYTTYTYPWAYSYPVADPRVAALEAKVETLEKMLAAVLSGRPAPKRR